ncbi:DNA/RNA non-specific endonuclease [Skermanella rosea]|uniref:DNA/RNA non-specific endonuclease n=1 Tax=Skermanella rosea TaxID=1817965 RepID=UPI001932DAB1|nr:DNA/RNA non-specific endonuclease [Skermanella rosea]UEM06178.1 DNA/RNA non-specific endonuclease [Skermanella rosea]
MQTPRPIEDYAGRSGYDPSFVDAAQPLPLPGTGAWEVAGVDPAVLSDGDDPHELKYTHFSVKVSTQRRLPLFSAVNIDGAKSDRTVKRTNVWRFDPRIGRELQILDGVYGGDKEGFFSRGHMTRREDPNWGDKKTAKQADADTFHATNACPQRQFQDSQVSIAGLSEDTGLDFGAYVPFDVLEKGDPGMQIALSSVKDLYLSP